MFNSLNSDGLPLYDSDIISAKLYAEAEKSKVGDEFTKRWKELIELIDELKQSGIANIDIADEIHRGSAVTLRGKSSKDNSGRCIDRCYLCIRR